MIYKIYANAVALSVASTLNNQHIDRTAEAPFCKVIIVISKKEISPCSFGNDLSFLYQLRYTSSSHVNNFFKLTIYGNDL